MFDSLDDAGIVNAIRSSAQAEAAACARRLLAIAELFFRRADADRSSGHEWWWLDTFDAVAAEVSSAQCITPGAAATQLRYAIALTDRLPKVAEVFASGLVSHRVVVAINRVPTAVSAPQPALIAVLNAGSPSRLRAIATAASKPRSSRDACPPTPHHHHIVARPRRRNPDPNAATTRRGMHRAPRTVRRLQRRRSRPCHRDLPERLPRTATLRPMAGHAVVRT